MNACLWLWMRLRSLGSKLNCWFLFINHLWMKAVDCFSMTLKTGDGRAVKARLHWGLNIDRPAGSCCSQSLVLTLSLTRLQQLRFSSQTQPWGRSAHWLPVYCSLSERWRLRQVRTFFKNCFVRKLKNSRLLSGMSRFPWNTLSSSVIHIRSFPDWSHVEQKCWFVVDLHVYLAIISLILMSSKRNVDEDKER